MDLGPATSVPAPKPAAKVPSPASFPKVGENAQKERDTDRRRILESELDSEQKNLEQAKKDLAEQEGVRSGDERNYQRVLERLEPFKNKVALHEQIKLIDPEVIIFGGTYNFFDDDFFELFGELEANLENSSLHIYQNERYLLLNSFSSPANTARSIGRTSWP